MPKGSLPGERRGGRQKGTPNRATAAQAAAIAASGLTPLDYMLSVLRDETAPRSERMEAAAKAAPYVHPRLAAIEYIIDDADEERFDLAELTDEERDLFATTGGETIEGAWQRLRSARPEWAAASASLPALAI